MVSPPCGRRVSTQFLIFPISTRVDITVCKHGKCFIFLKCKFVTDLHSHLLAIGSNKRSNQLAASWSAGVAQKQTRKHDSQLKTWTGNDLQSVKNKTWSSNKHDDESQPAWNNDTRVPTYDFDELFQMQNGDPGRKSQQQTPEKYRGGNNNNGVALKILQFYQLSGENLNIALTVFPGGPVRMISY